MAEPCQHCQCHSDHVAYDRQRAVVLAQTTADILAADARPEAWAAVREAALDLLDLARRHVPRHL